MRYLLIFLICLFVFPLASHADEETIIRNCQREFREETEPYWTILRWMADYRAAVDAGYKGCAEVYPDKFAEADAEGYFEYWQENTEIEYEQGFEVVNTLVDEIYEDIDDECDGRHTIRDRIKEESRAAADSQYEKAHQRRLKAITNDGLSGTGEDAILEFDENDSCKIILESLENYRRFHTSREDVQFALFTFATEHSAMTNRKDRDTRDAIRAFDKQRKTITYSVFGD